LERVLIHAAWPVCVCAACQGAGESAAAWQGGGHNGRRRLSYRTVEFHDRR
jgi:hypothetical protein